jgi:hypothetical protein
MRATLIVIGACLAATSQQSPALAARVIANDFIQLRNVHDSQFTIGIGSDISWAFSIFEYSGHSVDLEQRSADLQYYRVANFGEVFNPLDPRVFGGLVDGGLGEVGEDDFYLGIWLPKGDHQTYQNYGQWYGWVHLRPVNGVLTMVDNAMSLDSRGIIVGTLEVVPEPASAGHALIGLVALLKLRIRDRRAYPLSLANC